MEQSQPPDEHVVAVPADIRARVMPAVLDELVRWGVERFSVEAMAERHRLDPALIYQYWSNRQQLIVDAALADMEELASATDTGSLRGDLLALARIVAERANSDVGRTLLRSLVIDRAGYHDEETRMMFWRARYSIVRGVVDRAKKRGEVRGGVNALVAVQLVMAPLNVRALYSDAVINREYYEAVADLVWHALASK
ncbi:TetR-like C-terminal domain-containing protein [Mycobacterium shigaense]|uniref:TetR-like C-terminal domain-containing protein n=1 Tax=Mycobacterium shigaense TaxID=722731 RepID=UPI000E567D06|nr:TetR-like C-terminal domain-containing protein [Mycobacterium shigaense]MEA1122808.1 TetR-like C-terminal domain-containing protein [Mycobacterium shigaense]